jgi:hypothetical protein
MKPITLFFIIFLLITFLLGMYLYATFSLKTTHLETLESKIETLSNNFSSDSKCPNLLVRKGKVLMLYNKNEPIVDGKNPIPFFNMDEYINYLEIQRTKGIDCPVLFLQQESNAQGEDVFRMRPSPFDLQGGLPQMINLDEKDKEIVTVIDANRRNYPYNSNNYPGFDPTSQYVGVYTNLDIIHDKTKQNEISDNPMDPNWAGTTYTQQMIDSGKYLENQVTRPVLTTPKTTFYPSIQNFHMPNDIL